MGREKVVVSLLVYSSILLLCGQAIAGSADNATLSPIASFSTAGSSASTVGHSAITFSALNNKSFTLTKL